MGNFCLDFDYWIAEEAFTSLGNIKEARTRKVTRERSTSSKDFHFQCNKSPIGIEQNMISKSFLSKPREGSGI